MISHNNYNSYIIMFLINILSSYLSNMNLWVDKYDDMRFSLNDLYMAFLMTGWMFLIMGIIYKEIMIAIIGLLLVVIFIWCIRTQFLITTNQYILGMIPHHSMAVHMSKKLLEKTNNIDLFLKNVINTQEKEIIFMKQEIK